MSDEKIRSAIKRGVAYGKARGLSEEHAEDLAQRWVINVYVSQTGQSLQQAFIDFLRSEFGDTRTTCGARKSADRLSNPGVSANDSGGEPADGGFDRFCDDKYGLRQKQMYLLTAQEIAIIHAIEKGMQVTQIADYLGVTCARISQRLSQMRKKMQIANLEKKLEVQWIKL